MGVNVYFSYKHAKDVSDSINTAIYAMFDNSPDDEDYQRVIETVANNLRFVKNQLDAYVTKAPPESGEGPEFNV